MNAATATSTSSGNDSRGNQPRAHSSAPSAATTSPPKPRSRFPARHRRQIVEQLCALLAVRVDFGHERCAPARNGLERGEFRRPGSFRSGARRAGRALRARRCRAGRRRAVPAPAQARPTTGTAAARARAATPPTRAAPARRPARAPRRTRAPACAHKYSTVSTSCVASDTRSPERRRSSPAGARRSSVANSAMRISASSRYAMSCASHDSSQCSTAATGAITSSAVTSAGNRGRPAPRRPPAHRSRRRR